MAEWERYGPNDEAAPSYDESEESWQAEAPQGDSDIAWAPLAKPGTQGFEATEEAEHRKVRESPARMLWQIALAALGIAIFVVLVIIWAGGTSSIGQDRALLALTAALVVILLAEILLLRPVYDALFRRVPSSLPLKPEQDNFVVGCPGCGTVFTITQHELDLGQFSCHNCGRPGYVKDYKLNRAAIRDERCRTCGNSYLEYKDHSECPVCHTFNEY